MIENGKFIPKWKHEYEMEKRPYHEEYKTNKLRELQQELRRNSDLISVQRERIEELEETAIELSDTKLDVSEVKVIINGEKYKII